MSLLLRTTGFALGALGLLAACSATAPPPTAATAVAAPADAWPAFSGRFLEEYFKANPFFAVAAGRHEFDGKMPDLSAAGIATEVALLKRLRAQAQGFEAAALTVPEREEREHLLVAIDTDLFWLERARAPFRSPSWYIDQLDPDVYLNRGYAPLAQRLRGYLGYARAIPGIAAAIRANLATPMPRTFIERGIAGFGGYADFYRKDVAPVFAAVADPQAQEELRQANAAAAAAMLQLKTWLEGERAHATQDFALGEPLFLEMLHSTERVDVPIEKLLQIGEADLKRNTEALGAACARFLPHGSLAACVDKMNADKPSGGAVAGAREQLAQLRAFIVEKNIVTVPSDEQALVAEAPPYNRANAAYIIIPGPYEKNLPSVYTISPPDPAWSARERAEYIPGKSSLLYTTVHEVWPGHFLQFLHANRNPSKIAGLWVGYAYAEGWAHYAEQLMWDEGLGEGDPGQHVGQLVNALERNVRYLAAIRLHTGGLSVAQAERMFREQAFLDPGDARQQAARGTYDPQYLDYTLGKLMIMKLRADWVAQQPGASAAADPRKYWHDFHDRFLSYTGPIPAIRTALVGEGGSLL
jgi:hypothetical protein